VSYLGSFENILRPAIIESVDFLAQTCTIRMYDRADNRTYTVALPSPSVASSSGILHNIEPQSVVIVGWSKRERPIILATLPNVSYLNLSIGQVDENISTDSPGYPLLGEGAIAAFSGNSLLTIDKKSGIKISSNQSNISADEANRIVMSCRESVTLNEGVFSLSGFALRDLRLPGARPASENDEDKLLGLSHIRHLTPITRDKYSAFSKLTDNSSTGSSFQRNPPYIENKKITYEFARSFAVGSLSDEADRLTDGSSSFLSQPNARVNTRSDVLNLNPLNYNLLTETVEGTVIDIYGNILDINRNPITFPELTDGAKATAQHLEFLDKLSRRSIKFHYEINSRKDIKGEISTETLDGEDLPIGHNHSRWSIDVDGEGLTKINIPASSDTGNIPLLTRYVTANLRAKNKTSSNTDNAELSDLSTFSPTSLDGVQKMKDIFHLPFSLEPTSGIELLQDSPESIREDVTEILYGTAYHDIVNTCSGLFSLSHPFGGRRAISTKPLDNSPSSEQKNAGGRSLFANLDGSLELNVGRDRADHKSIVLDTSGGIISRIGKTLGSDNSVLPSASIISQLDGSIFVQIGGDVVGDEQRLLDPVVKIIVKGSKGNDEISVDEKSVRIKSAVGGKNIVLDSGGNLVLKAARGIILAGSTVGVHGTADDDGNELNPGRLIMNKGKEI
jgi:hypothetical protein